MNKADIKEIIEIQEDIRTVKTLISLPDTSLMVVMSKLGSIDNKIVYLLQNNRVRFKSKKYNSIKEIETR